MNKKIAKLKFNNELQELKLGDSKQSVKEKIRKAFDIENELKLLESKYNIVIKGSYCEKYETSYVISFKFNENEELIYVDVNNPEKARLESIMLGDREYKEDEFISIIESGENYYIDCTCPFYDGLLDFKEKKCKNTYVDNCEECGHRCGKQILSEFSEYGIQLRLQTDLMKWFTMTNLEDKERVYEDYGFDYQGDKIVDFAEMKDSLGILA